MVLDTGEHLLALVVGERHPGDFGGSNDRCVGDLGARFDVRPEHAREKRTAEPESGEMSEKEAAIGQWQFGVHRTLQR